MKNAIVNAEMVKKYTKGGRTFKPSFDGRYLQVYNNNEFSGFIWNNDKVIFVDGDRIISREFFN